MAAPKSLPARPSLESLRKQAKKLARDVTAGDAAALARARAHFPQAEPPLTQRNAQLVIAREYGFAGWQDLAAEVGKRLGRGLEWAVKQARRLIHDNDVDGLERLLAEYPALLSWQEDDEDGGLLRMAASPYAFDVADAQREQDFTRAECAELLIDAGAIVAPSVCATILETRARGLLALFERKELLPRTLEYFAALGDVDAVRAGLRTGGSDAGAVRTAFVRACLFGHEAVAAVLLEHCIALDAELGRRIDEDVGRPAFIRCFVETRAERLPNIGSHAKTMGLWKTFVMEQISRSVQDDDADAFAARFRSEPWLLGDECIDLQNELLGCGRAELVAALLDLDPVIVRRPPPSDNIEYALIEAKPHLVPLLTRVWPMPDDLPHAAGMGDFPCVKRWFDADCKPALGDVAKHAPATSQHRPWNDIGVQQVLDTALAWAVINGHFAIADFLLAHGANVNTDWNSHEPASILHYLVFMPDPYERMQYLIDRGIDLTIKDYRWNATAQGWAYHALKDEKMAQWLADAELRRSGES